MAARLAGGLWKKRPSVPPSVNNGLKLLRYGVLALVLFLTYRTAELVFRAYDPFFLIFSGFGHGSEGWISVIVLGLILVGALAIPMFFCRYLCPLGATFDPLSRLGLVRIYRDGSKCTGCGRCNRGQLGLHGEGGRSLYAAIILDEER